MLHRTKSLTCAAMAMGLAAILVAPGTHAQVVAPQPLEQPQPAAPEDRFGFSKEGWVVLRYIVRADGSTDDVVVIDKQPPELQHRDAVAAVEDWTFAPATPGGEPIDWYNNETVIRFGSPDAQGEPSPFTVQAYRETQALIDEGELERALRSNERMMMNVSQLTAIGLGLMQNAVINLQLGDLHAAYAAIERATDPRVGALQGSDLIVALQYRNVLEMQLGYVMDALTTLERRRALAPVPDDDAVAANAAAIEQALSDGATVTHNAKIIEDVWRHALRRRTFAIELVNGDIEVINAECDRRTAELEYAPDAEWALPESWGACAVAVEGRDDTEFRFYEFQ